MRLFGPRRPGRAQAGAQRGAGAPAQFPIEIHELKDGDGVSGHGYERRAFDVDHRIHALGYALVEPDRRACATPRPPRAWASRWGRSTAACSGARASSSRRCPSTRCSRWPATTWRPRQARRREGRPHRGAVPGPRPPRPGLKWCAHRRTRPAGARSSTPRRPTCSSTRPPSATTTGTRAGDRPSPPGRRARGARGRRAEAGAHPLLQPLPTPTSSELVRQAREEFPRGVEFAKDGCRWRVGYADAAERPRVLRPASGGRPRRLPEGTRTPYPAYRRLTRKAMASLAQASQ
jgi:hypothetical protein